MKPMSCSFIRTTCALVTDLVLMPWPDVAIDYIVITTGILFPIPGFIVLIGHFGTKPEPSMFCRFPIEGVGGLLFGFWLVTMPGSFTDVLMFLLDSILIIGGVQQIASLSTTRRWMPVPNGFYVIPALTLIVGVVALFNPTGARNTAFMIVDISSLVYAISELTSWLKLARHRPKTPMKGEIGGVEITK